MQITNESNLPKPVYQAMPDGTFQKLRTIQQQLLHEMGTKAPTLKDHIQHNQKSRPEAKSFGTIT